MGAVRMRVQIACKTLVNTPLVIQMTPVQQLISCEMKIYVLVRKKKEICLQNKFENIFSLLTVLDLCTFLSRFRLNFFTGESNVDRGHLFQMLILTAPIHCRGSIGEHKSVLMK